ncbi:SDR family NAD(P)-dependent oxidoreductase [Micrococcales bacterium 31B]|nr:SDR family NAD(P)-dependent oxidoreductase [Micrococcales bacterium 31B]
MTDSLRGKTVVITGASSGIGEHTARVLARRGARVIAVGRNPERTLALEPALGTQPLLADFVRLDEVRRLAAAVLSATDRIDIIVHNAGGFFFAPSLTDDGFERTLQVNYLAPFLLHRLLHERLAASAARVIITSSTTHRMARADTSTRFDVPRPYRMGTTAYAASKLYDLMWARALARRTPDTGMTAVAVHPGNVRTAINSNGPRFIDWLYSGPVGRPFTIDAAANNGHYVDRHEVNGRMSPPALDAGLVEQLWSHTEMTLGLAPLG